MVNTEQNSAGGRGYNAEDLNRELHRRADEKLSGGHAELRREVLEALLEQHRERARLDALKMRVRAVVGGDAAVLALASIQAEADRLFKDEVVAAQKGVPPKAEAKEPLVPDAEVPLPPIPPIESEQARVPKARARA